MPQAGRDEPMRADLAPERLLAAYAAGIFPMADEHGGLHWLAPDPRAIIELDDLRISRSLRAAVRRDRFKLTVNRASADVIDACAARPEGTWISPEIKVAYGVLCDLGYAHSVEAWHKDRLVGGLYGVSIGGAFFGESMFHLMTDASKVVLVHLVERMKQRGLKLLDVQFQTPHLASLGAVEIPRDIYEHRLYEAVRLPVAFVEPPWQDVESDGSEPIVTP